jgi:phenylalanyl-tRNA synthetase beta chain
MLVSWEWLSQYVDLDMSPDELASRLSLSGLNHESTTMVGGDPIIDLEVTSNRGDCLGHIGVAREVAVLYDKKLKLPEIVLTEASTKASERIRLANEYIEGCPRYTARVIRGVKVGPSPAWLVKRLAAIGIKSVNNVVDVTNFVMFECGQPLHAFDLAKIRGGQVVVRQANPKESFVAIDHKTYTLEDSAIVIADSQRAIALGGVMGGENSEVSVATVDLLIESADFKPLLVRHTARSLRLQSPASYRFERRE